MLELMVVVAIVGILATSVRPGFVAARTSTLDGEARRLALAIERAGAESRAGAARLSLRLFGDGYAFEARGENAEILALAGRHTLPAGMEVGQWMVEGRPHPGDTLPLGPGPMPLLELRLGDGIRALRIAAMPHGEVNVVELP